MKKLPFSLWLVLGVLAITTLPCHAQFVFQFEQQGGNTVVTGSGSTTSGPVAGGVTWLVGFAGDYGGSAPVMTNTVPTGWNPAASDVFLLSLPDPGSTLSVGGVVQLNRLAYTSGPGPGEALGVYNSIFFGLPPATYMTASGAGTFPNPLVDLFANHAPGTVLVVIPGVLHFIIGVAPVDVPKGGGSAPTVPPTIASSSRRRAAG